MAKYDLYKVHGIDNKEGETLYRARLVSEGTIGKDRLYDWAARVGGVSRGQIDAVMAFVTDAAIDYLCEGYDVQLGELGYLSATVSSRQVKKKKEIRSESVRFKNINLRISRMVRRKMNVMPLERVSKPVAISQEIATERCEELLRGHLATHPCITRAEYERMTRQLRGKAIDDLNRFIEAGWLTKYGAGRTVVYLMK